MAQGTQEAWDQLQFALRLGENPRQVVTTTPANVGVLKTLLKTPSTVMTHAPTEANKANLAASFLEEVQAHGLAAPGWEATELEGVRWRMPRERAVDYSDDRAGTGGGFACV